jgi:ABC-2 type transport system permease protein
MIALARPFGAFARCFRDTLRGIARQKSVLTLLIGSVVVLSFFYPLPYLGQVLRDLPVVVVDRDHSQLSRQFARWLDAAEATQVAARLEDLGAAQEMVQAGEVGAVVLIPKDFERDVLRGKPAYVEAYVDASYMLVRTTALRGVNAVAATLSTGVAVRRLQATGATFDAALHRRQPVTFVPWALFNPLAGYGSFVVPSVFILLLQHTLLIGIGTLRVAERQAQGNETEPIWAVLAGKVGALTLVYLVHAALMFAVVFKLYGFPMRASWLETLTFLVPYLAAATLLGLVIAELFDRPESSSVALAAASVPAVFLSGMSFPAEAQAPWAQALALLIPSTFGIRGFLRLAEMGAHLGEAARPWAALWIQAAVYGAFAGLLLWWRRSRGPAACP